MYFCSQLESAKLKKKKKKKKTVITIRFTFKKGNIFWTLKSNYLFVKLLLPLSFSSVQSLSHVRLFFNSMDCSTPGLPVYHQLSEFTQTQVHWISDPSNHLILCHPLLLPPSIFPSIRVFSNESAFHISGRSTGVSASTSVLPMNIQNWFPLGLSEWISWESKGLSRVSSNTTVQKHQFFGAQLSSQSNSHIHTWPQEKP